MEIKQKIKITGRNWNDIISLPCFRLLRHYPLTGDFDVLVDTGYISDGVIKSHNLLVAKVGDTLVEYTDGGWELIIRNDVDDD